MDISNLKWTKSITRDDGRWAYSYDELNTDSNFFGLHWKSDSIDNARRPQEKDLIILRQKGKVTHLVELVNNSIYDDEHNEGWIYRLVRIIWMADVWSNPPHQKDIFDCEICLMGGKAIDINNIQTLRERWDYQGGISGFQTHVMKKLKLA